MKYAPPPSRLSPHDAYRAASRYAEAKEQLGTAKEAGRGAFASLEAKQDRLAAESRMEATRGALRMFGIDEETFDVAEPEQRASMLRSAHASKVQSGQMPATVNTDRLIR